MRESRDPKAWWWRALEDRDAARSLCEKDADKYADVIWMLCQQACEKMLKACMMTAGKKFGRIHDLEELAEQVKESTPVVDRIFPALIELSTGFTQSRYPYDFDREFGPDDAKQSVETVEKLEALLRGQVAGPGGDEFTLREQS